MSVQEVSCVIAAAVEARTAFLAKTRWNLPQRSLSLRVVFFCFMDWDTPVFNQE